MNACKRGNCPRRSNKMSTTLLEMFCEPRFTPRITDGLPDKVTHLFIPKRLIIYLWDLF